MCFLHSGKAVLVNYVVSLQTMGHEISSETLDFINMQLNIVEGNLSDLEKPTVQYTITDLNVYITEALLGTQSCELSLIPLNEMN